MCVNVNAHGYVECMRWQTKWTRANNSLNIYLFLLFFVYNSNFRAHSYSSNATILYHIHTCCKRMQTNSLTENEGKEEENGRTWGSKRKRNDSSIWEFFFSEQISKTKTTEHKKKWRKKGSKTATRQSLRQSNDQNSKFSMLCECGNWIEANKQMNSVCICMANKTHVWRRSILLYPPYIVVRLLFRCMCLCGCGNSVCLCARACIVCVCFFELLLFVDLVTVVCTSCRSCCRLLPACLPACCCYYYYFILMLASVVCMMSACALICVSVFWSFLCWLLLLPTTTTHDTFQQFSFRPIHVQQQQQQLTLLQFDVYASVCTCLRVCVCVFCTFSSRSRTSTADRPSRLTSAACFIDVLFCCTIFQYHQISRPIRIDFSFEAARFFSIFRDLQKKNWEPRKNQTIFRRPQQYNFSEQIFWQFVLFMFLN